LNRPVAGRSGAPASAFSTSDSFSGRRRRGERSHAGLDVAFRLVDGQHAEAHGDGRRQQGDDGDGEDDQRPESGSGGSPRGNHRLPRKSNRRDEEVPMEARPSAVATVNTAAAAKVERRVFATTGTSAMNAGRSRRKAAAAPSLAMRHAWLDLQEEIPVDVVEHEDVETSGAKTSAAPVATAVPSVSARRPRGIHSYPQRRPAAHDSGWCSVDEGLRTTQLGSAGGDEGTSTTVNGSRPCELS
jgi:hypothetical protein